MKRIPYSIIPIVGLCLLAFVSSPAEAGIRVGINIGLPLISFPSPPVLAVIPGSYVYSAANCEPEILFFEGQWYRSWNNRWHRARSYNGPWSAIGPRRVPGALLRLPAYYRQGGGHHRGKLHAVNNQWQGRERERSRESRQDWGRGRREFSRVDRERGQGHHTGTRW